MEPALLHVVRETLLVVLVASGPPLGAALLVGVLTGVVQAAMQLHEPTLGVVPRIVAVFAALALASAWLGARVLRLAEECLEAATRLGP